MQISVLHLIQQTKRIKPGRMDGSKSEELSAYIARHEPFQYVEAAVNGYTTKIELNIDRISVRGIHSDDVRIHCTCRDFSINGPDQPCKHILKLAQVADNKLWVNESLNFELKTTISSKSKEEIRDEFRAKLSKLIDITIGKLSNNVNDLLQKGEVPFLIGPTGVGKTSAVRRCAVQNGWKFEEIAGSESFADADLVGLRTDRMEQPGIFARAFKRARNGDTVLVFLDEMLRFNIRAQDLLMRPVQRTQKEVAKAMGLAVDCDVYIVEAPMWGVEWAPADNIHFVLAANPWGSAIDPALARRTYPLLVEMDEDVLMPFDSTLADGIKASWRSAKQGELPLPMEYQLLMTAESPDDISIFKRYLYKIEIIDEMAADGFRTLLEGVGLYVDNDK